MKKTCDTCYWHLFCASEAHDGCNGNLWTSKENGENDVRIKGDIDKIVSDCSDFCHFADELHRLVVKSHKVDDLVGTKEKCLAYAAQLWFHNKEKLIKGDK